MAMISEPISPHGMDTIDRAGGLGIELLNGFNYEVWKTTMKSYLTGEDLWDVVAGKDTKNPDKDAVANEITSADAVKKWTRLNAKAEFALKSSISHSLFDHIIKCESAHEIWDKLDRLLKKRDGEAPAEAPHAQDHDPIKLYRGLRKAALKGDWEAAKRILEKDPEALTAKITERGETALHVAADVGHAKFIEKLVALMPQEALEIKEDKDSRTALHYAAVIGNLDIVKTLVAKNGRLMETADRFLNTPLHVAAYFFQNKHKEVVRYLTLNMPDQSRDGPFFAGSAAGELISKLTASRSYELCLHLLDKYPFLATAVNGNGTGMLHALMFQPSEFPCGRKLGFWGNCIYQIIPVEFHHKPRCSSSKGDLEDQQAKEPSTLLQSATSCLTHVMHWIYGASWTAIEHLVPGIKHIKHEKFKHKCTQRMVEIACQQMSGWSQHDITTFFTKSTDSSILPVAAENGVVDLITTCLQYFPHLIQNTSILMEAVLNRQEKVFNLFLGDSVNTKYLAVAFDEQTKENVAHKAARLAPYPQLSSVSCSALQMQRELQWYKAVEKLLTPTQVSFRNRKQETPRGIFTNEHRELLEDAKKWMKNTSDSCMLVATLIATVVFTAAFTVPGGYVNGKGIPLYLEESVFILFAVSDTLGLFSSTTSILMFLSILTARYAEEDFLYSLPKRLILGLASLFLAIASMMVAFGATLYMVLSERFKWIFIPIMVITSIPAALFVMLQLPLFIYMLGSTYGPGIFHPKNIW
ncbi:uncharacterized protein LOC116187339 isoform X2 [Punica granatum]|uniref:Uncharacterized protein LOC116187339 isoform X2 n=1 Tax=Punica granatum TaxID=22663 RepID=A0A6P8BND8_PUNGR|nr:uncharacterized protein LOC116187339 isoform X2 [Punica granatum]